jgi:hypothetical protein
VCASGGNWVDLRLVVSESLAIQITNRSRQLRAGVLLADKVPYEVVCNSVSTAYLYEAADSNYWMDSEGKKKLAPLTSLSTRGIILV